MNNIPKIHFILPGGGVRGARRKEGTKKEERKMKEQKIEGQRKKNEE